MRMVWERSHNTRIEEPTSHQATLSKKHGYSNTSLAREVSIAKREIEGTRIRRILGDADEKQPGYSNFFLLMKVSEVYGLLEKWRGSELEEY